jgi:hypothetical protein
MDKPILAIEVIKVEEEAVEAYNKLNGFEKACQSIVARILKTRLRQG